MRPLYVLPATSGTQDPDGTVTLARVFDYWWFREFPAVAKFTIASAFEVRRDDEGQGFRLKVVDPEGGIACTMDRLVERVVVDDDFSTAVYTHFFDVDITCPRPGDYEIVLEASEGTLSFPLRVIRRAPVPA